MEIKPRLWSVHDVAEYLGVPVKTLYDWRAKGYGPRGKKVGRYLRFDGVEVLEWFASLADDAA
jgi:excisionase family DNA binding protein